MDEKFLELPVDGRVDTCPQCGYTTGFHVSFLKQPSFVKSIVICPECHTRFDANWILASESRGWQ
ncbi:MAG: hypothetical protein KKC68_03460 [Candidatus Thermoplasmatota archaeon]|nr:hypothetical protein [Candidatus Thermoplasmatota archaeon]MBU1940811.1 hypothetical protein [Candidatus Thermoplasmatota archaeon]